MSLDYKITFPLLIILAASGCALLGGNEEMGKKNNQIKYKNPQSPFEEVTVSSADKVWQSSKTGSTIAVNSLCKNTEDPSFENLKKNILAGFENLKVDKTENITFDEREAQKMKISGTTDSVPVTINLLIFKKNSCSYDIAYIARTNHYEKEKLIYEKFLEGFHAP